MCLLQISLCSLAQCNEVSWKMRLFFYTNFALYPEWYFNGREKGWSFVSQNQVRKVLLEVMVVSVGLVSFVSLFLICFCFMAEFLVWYSCYWFCCCCILWSLFSEIKTHRRCTLAFLQMRTFAIISTNTHLCISKVPYNSLPVDFSQSQVWQAQRQKLWNKKSNSKIAFVPVLIVRVWISEEILCFLMEIRIKA